MEDSPAMSDGNLNISDIIAVLETDPDFEAPNRGDIEMFPEPNPQVAAQQQPPQQQQQRSGNNRPRVEIVEQPAGKALRFRYICEGRSAGSIPGVNSTTENKTFPSIRIVGYRGRAIVVVSCVTKDLPYRPHPHNLVGKEVCKDGVYTAEVSSDNMTISFDKLGIQCVKKKDIEGALKKREQIRVDPFRTGFDHKRQPTSLDLNAVRLCFQVFLEGPVKGKFNFPLDPVVSDPIYDKKAMSDLVITKLSHCSAPVAGGTEMVLLCEKVARDDIQVRFFEEKDGHTVWEGFGDFQPTNVHKQVAIAFKTPSYRTHQVDQPIQVYIQLKRPSDGAISEALYFQLLPLDDADSLKRKRIRFQKSPNVDLMRQVRAEAEKQPRLLNPMPQYNFDLIKPEPRETLSPFERPMGSPPMFPIDNINTNMLGLRPMPSPCRTPSPMECALYNLPSVQPGQNINYQLQPIFIPQGSPSPVLIPDPIGMNQLGNVGDNAYTLGNGDTISNAIGSALNLGNVFDEPQQNTDFELNLSQLDNTIDLNSLNISDIVKGPVNGDNAAGINIEESGMTDSFTKLTRNTIQDLCSLNNMYKPPRDNGN